MKTVRPGQSLSNYGSPRRYPSAPRELPVNRISIESEKKNRLNTRVKPFIKYPSAHSANS